MSQQTLEIEQPPAASERRRGLKACVEAFERDQQNPRLRAALKRSLGVRLLALARSDTAEPGLLELAEAARAVRLLGPDCISPDTAARLYALTELKRAPEAAGSGLKGSLMNFLSVLSAVKQEDFEAGAARCARMGDVNFGTSADGKDVTLKSSAEELLAAGQQAAEKKAADRALARQKRAEEKRLVSQSQRRLSVLIPTPRLAAPVRVEPISNPDLLKGRLEILNGSFDSMRELLAFGGEPAKKGVALVATPKAFTALSHPTGKGNRPYSLQGRPKTYGISDTLTEGQLSWVRGKFGRKVALEGMSPLARQAVIRRAREAVPSSSPQSSPSAPGAQPVPAATSLPPKEPPPPPPSSPTTGGGAAAPRPAPVPLPDVAVAARAAATPHLPREPRKNRLSDTLGGACGWAWKAGWKTLRRETPQKGWFSDTAGALGKWALGSPWEFLRRDECLPFPKIMPARLGVSSAPTPVAQPARSLTEAEAYAEFEEQCRGIRDMAERKNGQEAPAQPVSCIVTCVSVSPSDFIGNKGVLAPPRGVKESKSSLGHWQWRLVEKAQQGLAGKVVLDSVWMDPAVAVALQAVPAPIASVAAPEAARVSASAGAVRAPSGNRVRDWFRRLAEGHRLTARFASMF